MRSITMTAALVLAITSGAMAQVGSNPHGRLPQGLDCTSCHTSESWRALRKDLQFDHDKTRFALSGKHEAAACSACHTGLRFTVQNTHARECGSCHTDVHTGRFSRDCASCHDAQSFTKASGPEVHARTSMPLTGAHANVPCESCHRAASSGYTALDTRCISCHQVDYDRVTLPDHNAAGFSLECTQCHTGTTWFGADFDHTAAANGFGLLGAHIRATCGSCHTAQGGLRFTPPPASQQECIACHNPDYQNEHSGSGYPTTCVTCHNLNTWDGATFNHSMFPLAGAHTALECTACHAPPDNALIYPAPAAPSDCVACHRSDYDRQHAADGFPTTCLSCHDEGSWSTFRNHDAAFFPIYSGAHAGRWSDCQECHTAAGDFRVFTCTTCHTPTETNGHHREVSGYAYESARCYSCHPRGES